MMSGKDFFHNLTRKQLSCGKNLIELTSYNDIIFWWFVDSNFHMYVDNLKMRDLKWRLNYLKQRLIFFYKKIELILDFLMLIVLKIILKLYGIDSRPRHKKTSRIIFTALNIEWKLVKDSKNRCMSKSDSLFDLFIKETQNQSKVIGTSPLNVSTNGIRILFEKLSCWDIPHKPFNLYWSINVWKKERDAFNYFNQMWKIIENDKIFRESCRYNGKDLYYMIISKIHLCFYYWLPRAVKYIEIAKEMVIKEEPDIFLIQDEITGFGRALIIAGKLMGIPTLAVQHGEITSLDYGYIYTKDAKKTVILADLTCVFGQYYHDLLTRQSIYDLEQVIVTGSLRSDMLYRTGEIYTKKQFLRKYTINPSHKIALWTTQCHGISEEENEKNFNAVFKSFQNLKSVTLIIKQHPREGIKHTKIIESYLKHHKINVKITPKKSDTYLQIYFCNLLVTRHSTTAMEAVALNKPVLILNLSEDNDIVDYVKEGVALGVYRSTDLRPAIKKLLEGADELTKNREKYIEKFLFKVDGKVAERISNIASEIMNKKF